MKNYLVIVESGKNNIAGVSLHILKYSFIINDVKSISEAYENSEQKIYSDQTFHFGHQADYTCIVDIKEI